MLGVLVVVYTFNFIDRQILSILLQPIKADLGLTDSAMGFLSGFSFAIFYATLGIPVAMLADRFNRRNIIAMALGLWSGMTALSGMANNFWQLAAARVGVGVGEAGGSPPAYSLLSDYFPKSQRATALAIYSMGLPLGILFGFLIGGWINQWFSWRTAFFVVGLPGVLLALVVRFTVREPARGVNDGAAGAAKAAPALGAVIAHLWREPVLRQVCFASMSIAFANYAFLTWTPAFLIRSHHLGTATVGTAMALVVGVFGAAAMLAAGWASDRLAQRDARWMAWLPALGVLCSGPGLIAMLTAEPLWLVFSCMAIPAAMGLLYLGPTLALMQTRVPPNMRAVSGAVFLFLSNLVGLGLGPQVVGMLSDALAPSLGTESLRYALMVAAAANILGALHFRTAARHLGD